MAQSPVAVVPAPQLVSYQWAPRRESFVLRFDLASRGSTRNRFISS